MEKSDDFLNQGFPVPHEDFKILGSDVLLYSVVPGPRGNRANQAHADNCQLLATQQHF